MKMYKQQTIKPILKVFLIVIFGLLSLNSCNEDEEVREDTSAQRLVDFVTEKEGELSAFDRTAISYFKEITLGSEFSEGNKITRKWNNDINIFVFGGDAVPELVSELNTVISDLNPLLSASNIKINIVGNISDANIRFFFETRFEFGDRFPGRRENLNSSGGLFFFNNNTQNQIISADVFVDTGRGNTTNQRSLVREELTQALGFANDSTRFRDSIFFEDIENDNTNITNRILDYSRLDRTVISLLYNPRVGFGLDANEVNGVLEEILLEN